MQLKGNKVFLRPPHKEDRLALATLANNKKIWDNVRDFLPSPYQLSDADFFIDLCRKEEPPLTFGIEYQQNYAGTIGLVRQNDIYRIGAEVGYWIGEPYWGKGIASEALELITRYGFEQLGLVRIFTGVFEYNLASMKVLEKAGYQFEGIFQKSLIKNGKIWNEHRYAIVKE